jgi:hypothetical protein
MIARRSCDELGLCQERTPRCPGCAPVGLVREPDFPNDRRISMWMKWALIWAAGTATVAALMFVAGSCS